MPNLKPEVASHVYITAAMWASEPGGVKSYVFSIDAESLRPYLGLSDL